MAIATKTDDNKQTNKFANIDLKRKYENIKRV